MLGVFFGIVALAATVGVHYRVTHDRLDVTAGLLFLTAVWAGLFAVAELTMRLLRCGTAQRANVRTLVTTIGILLIAVELVLRAGVGRYATYQEKNGRAYQRLPHYSATWFHVHDPHEDVNYSSPEFAFHRQANALGLSEADITPDKAAGEYRIVALGDSFTEGVGTSYEATWVKVLERELAVRSPGHRVTTINAGIAGSDICAEYLLLREKLVSYDPDLVVVATNWTDVEDITWRGGLNRFQPDGSVRFRHAAPSWEWLYGISYLSRPLVHEVFGYGRWLTKRSLEPSEQLVAVADMRSAVEAFAALARERGFRLLFVLHPGRFEVENGRYRGPFRRLAADLKLVPGIEVLDVLGYWRERRVVTPENAAGFYWPVDLHHNPRGYAALGLAVADRVVRMKVLPE